MKLSVVIVNWNTAGPLRRALRSLTPIAGIEWEPIVIDNQSSDDSVAMVRREFPQVRLLANADNRGFGRACNQGFAVASGDYILLLNPDAELMPGAISTLLSYLEARPEVGMVGPTLFHEDGATQYSACRSPSLLTEAYEWLGLRGAFPRHRGLGRLYYGYANERAFACDWLVGACLLVRREALQAVGGFDERYWLYAEELDWCRRFREGGWPVHFVPAARVRHLGGASSAQHPQPMLVEWFRSRHQYHAKFDSWPVRAALVGLYGLALGLRVLVYHGWAGLDRRRRAQLRRDAAIFAACWQFHLALLRPSGPPPRRPDTARTA